MRRCWINPNPVGQAITPQDVVFVDDHYMPQQSPAPANNGTIIPEGWVLQIGSDGEADTMLGDVRAGLLQYQANIDQFCVPYITGGWPPDPQAGLPGHVQ